MINNITEYMNRTFLIVNRIKELINEKRRILLLSDRRNHLADIFKLSEQQKYLQCWILCWWNEGKRFKNII